MIEAIVNSFDIWTDAQGVKSKTRVSSVENISLEGYFRLRELILEVAMQGKLVPQDSRDEPASELLIRIEEEKKRLIKNGEAKVSENTLTLTEHEKRFDLPLGWEWTKVRNIGHDWGQKTPDKEFCYIDVSAIDNHKGAVISPTILQANNAPSRARKIVKFGTIIYSTVRPYLKNICVISEEYIPEPIASTAFAILHPYLLMPGRFFFLFFRSPMFVKYVESVQTGIAYPAINDKQFFSALIPLPPLNEQHRIVAKVDRLMALCDQLEEEQFNNLKTHQQLVKAFLKTLTQAANAKEFQSAWERMSPHFDTLFCTKDSIDQLKQTILQLAVIGKLIKQDANDEPARKFIIKLEKEKKTWTEEGRLNNQTSLSAIHDKEKPFTLPKNWEWLKLGTISADVRYGYTASANRKKPSIHFLRITDIQNDEVDWPSVPGCDIDIKRAASYLLEEGDILIARTGGTIGKSYLVTNLSVKSIFASYLIRVKKLRSSYSPYIKIFLGTQLYWHQLYESSKGTGQPNVNGNALKNLKLPFPPLSEQKRIVRKVTELMEVCDALGDNISRSQVLKSELSKTILEKAVRIFRPTSMSTNSYREQRRLEGEFNTN